MRLATAEVKSLLVRGKRTVAHADGMTLAGKTVIRETTEPAVRGGFAGARLALAVPKRHLKRAVDRNRVKRALREAFRLDPAMRAANVDLMVTLTSLDKSLMDKKAGKKAAARAAAAALFARILNGPASRAGQAATKKQAH